MAHPVSIVADVPVDLNVAVPWAGTVKLMLDTGPVPKFKLKGLPLSA
jgi:hypothetical protein